MNGKLFCYIFSGLINSQKMYMLELALRQGWRIFVRASAKIHKQYLSTLQRTKHLDNGVS